MSIGALGHLLLVYGSLRPLQARDTVAVLRRREQIAVMAPVLPLLPVAIVVVASIVTGVKLAPVTLVLLGGLVASILVSTLFARLDQLVLSRTLEHRVVERTLALRTHAKWFRALVQNSSDVITIVDPSGTIHYQTPSAARRARLQPRSDGRTPVRRVASD